LAGHCVSSTRKAEDNSKQDPKPSTDYASRNPTPQHRPLLRKLFYLNAGNHLCLTHEVQRIQQPNPQAARARAWRV